MKLALMLIAGLAIFLYAMLRLSAEGQRLVTMRIRQYIRRAVGKPGYGILTGLATTVLFQSSSAATALTVGMVSAGLISFYDSLGILLGADIGTVITVQLVLWKLGDWSPLIVLGGGVLWYTAIKPWSRVGKALFYLGLLFFGLSLVGFATSSLKEHPEVLHLFREARNPLFGFGLGLIFTAIVHASVIPVSILVFLAQADIVTLKTALPVVLGANVGTTVTALMAGAVATVNGKRTAVSHFLFKVSGVMICMVFMPQIIAILESFSNSTAQQIIYGHLLLNLLIAGLFIFALKPFASFVEKLLPGKEKVLPLWPEYLDDRYLASPDPDDALKCVQRELEREMILAQEMFEEATGIIRRYGEAKRRRIVYMELVVDHLRREIVNYLWKISCQNLSESPSKRLFAYTAMVDDIERIADHAKNIADMARDKFERNILFSEFGEQELEDIHIKVSQNIKDALQLIGKHDVCGARAIRIREDAVDEAVKDAREQHLIRFHRRICQAEAGPIFVEILIQFERISDHCDNIAEYILDLGDAPP